MQTLDRNGMHYVLCRSQYRVACDDLRTTRGVWCRLVEAYRWQGKQNHHAEENRVHLRHSSFQSSIRSRHMVVSVEVLLLIGLQARRKVVVLPHLDCLEDSDRLHYCELVRPKFSDVALLVLHHCCESMHLRFFDDAPLVLLCQTELVLRFLELEFPPQGVRHHRRLGGAQEELFVRT